MKRILCGLIAAVMVVGLSGCADSTFENVKLDSVQTLEELTYNIDSSWEKDENDNIISYFPYSKKTKGIISVSCKTLDSEVNPNTISFDNIRNLASVVFDELYVNSKTKITTEYGREILDYPTAYAYGVTTVNGIEYATECKLIFLTKRIYCVYILSESEMDKNFRETYYNVLKSIDIKDYIGGYAPGNQAKADLYSDGTKLYIEGIVERVENEENQCFILINQNDKDSWKIEIGAFPEYSNTWIENIDGDSVRVFFEYKKQVNSNITATGSILSDGKIESIVSGDIYKPNYVPDEEYQKWVNENYKIINYANISDKENIGKYVLISGVVSDVYQSVFLNENNFYLYEKIGVDFVSSYINCPNNLKSIDSLYDGNSIKLCGYVNEDKTLSVYRILKSEPTFTLSDIVSDYKNKCTSYSYDTIARNPDLYKGEKAVFTGEVVQTIESSIDVAYRVNITETTYGYKDTIYVSYSGADKSDGRILDGDIITIWGTINGLKTYDTILGSSITIPSVYAKYVKVK